MAISPQKKAAAARRAREAIRGVKTVERRALVDIRAGLAEVRGDLLARLATGTPFDRAMTLSLLREADRAASEVERILAVPVVGAQRAAERIAIETFAKNMEAQGIRDLPVTPLLRQSDLLVAQREAIGDLVVGVTDDFRRRLRSELRQTLMGGQTLADFQRRIGRALPASGPFGTVANRAEVIVRTETSKTFQFAQEAQRQEIAEAGFEFRKQWVSSRDGRVRPTHAAADGQTVGAEEDFDIGGYPAAFPQDPRLPPEESIQCRCEVIEIFEESSRVPSGGRDTLKSQALVVPEITVTV